jgi:hypothetical protein
MNLVSVPGIERPRRKRRGILKTRFDFTPQAAGNQTRKRLNRQPENSFGRGFEKLSHKPVLKGHGCKYSQAVGYQTKGLDNQVWNKIDFVP